MKVQVVVDALVRQGVAAARGGQYFLGAATEMHDIVVNAVVEGVLPGAIDCGEEAPGLWIRNDATEGAVQVPKHAVTVLPIRVRQCIDDAFFHGNAHKFRGAEVQLASVGDHDAVTVLGRAGRGGCRGGQCR